VAAGRRPDFEVCYGSDVTISPAERDCAVLPPAPPEPSAGVFSDVRRFLFAKAAIPTLLRFSSEAEREDYSQRILQRVGVNVEKYAILNIHRIGIEIPVVHVFEELLKWGEDSVWWPNHLATVVRSDGGLEHLRVTLLGRGAHSRTATSGAGKPQPTSLFELTALRILGRPHPADSDNARYLLYECKGGYPIGIFAMYVRSPIADLGEQERAQLFFAVGFDFYGRKDWSRTNPVNRVWEAVHNRATANIMNRFKRLCEWRFADSTRSCDRVDTHRGREVGTSRGTPACRPVSDG
jgi:hypothetical protein